MTTTIHKVFLQNNEHFGKRLPLHHLGRLLADLPLALRASVSMAFRKRSSSKNQRHPWLDRASDVRFVGHDGNGDSVLYFEAPKLGEAAPELYEQQLLFPELEQKPDPLDTAFDVFGDVLGDLSRRNADSSRYDSALLGRIADFRSVFNRSPYREVDFTSRRFPSNFPARLNPALVDAARKLRRRTPAPQRIRLVGKLDGLIASTQWFSVLLDTGEVASGVFTASQIEAMKELWRQRVLVLGTAIYRASGRLLRVEAEEIRSGENEPTVFSRLPSSPLPRLDLSKLHKPQGPKSGIAAVIGRWPGNESDEEIEAILEELS